MVVEMKVGVTNDEDRTKRDGSAPQKLPLIPRDLLVLRSSQLHRDFVCLLTKLLHLTVPDIDSMTWRKYQSQFTARSEQYHARLGELEEDAITSTMIA